MLNTSGLKALARMEPNLPCSIELKRKPKGHLITGNPNRRVPQAQQRLFAQQMHFHATMPLSGTANRDTAADRRCPGPGHIKITVHDR